MQSSKSNRGETKRQRHTLLAACALLGLASCAAPAQPGETEATTASIEALSEPLCGLPGNEQLAVGAKEVDDGIMDYEAWSAEPLFQAELPKLSEVLEPFAEHMLDTVLDHQAQQIVVPVDAELLAGGDVQRALEAAHLALPLRVQTACRPVADLRAAERTVLDLDWHPAASAVRFGMHWDPEHAQLVATFDRGDAAEPRDEAATAAGGGATSIAALSGRGDGPMVVAPQPAMVTEVAKALEQRLGDIIRVEFGIAGRHSRWADQAPHRGAAAVGEVGRNFCTSGFIVRRTIAGSPLSSITAGHCFANGNPVFSSGIRYGTAQGRAPFPQFDLIRIDRANDSFQRQIWTDPGAPTTRTQTAKADVPPQALLCTSGANVNTLAICNIRVAQALGTCTICDNGCTPGLTRGTKLGVTLNRPGDSGAPMYTRTGADGAQINGMAVGSSDGSDVCWHPRSVVEARLGVLVATN